MAAGWMKLSLIIVFTVVGNCTRFRDWRLDYGEKERLSTSSHEAGECDCNGKELTAIKLKLIELTQEVERLINAPKPTCRTASESVCPSGWVRHANSCYYIIDTPTVERDDALKKCQQLGGDLPKITSGSQNQFIFNLLRKQNTVTVYGAWLGLHRKADTKFYWADDTPLSGYTNWGATEPSNPAEKCGHMIGLTWRAGKWNDISCTFPSAFHPSTAPVILCEKNCTLTQANGN